MVPVAALFSDAVPGDHVDPGRQLELAELAATETGSCSRESADPGTARQLRGFDRSLAAAQTLGKQEPAQQPSESAGRRSSRPSLRDCRPRSEEHTSELQSHVNL